MKKTPLFLIFLIIALFGCTTTQKGAAVGAGGGAVLGGIIGHQSGHGATGAAIGAAAGGLVGILVGEQMDKKFCPVCGTHYTGGLKYCPKCGAELQLIEK